jgi:hypothetical protein
MNGPHLVVVESDEAEHTGCRAALNIRGEHYWCQEPAHLHVGVHHNTDAQAIWWCGTEEQR